MKFLFFTDPHIGAVAPICRKDKWPDAIFNKLKQIIHLADQEKIDYLLCGGDWFKSNTPNPPYWLVGEMIEILKAGPPIITILGQHDIYGHDYTTYSRGVHGLLNQLSNFHVLNGSISIQNCRILGLSYHSMILPTLKAGQFSDADICLIHAMITPQPVIWEHILSQEIPKQWSICFCGDYHPGLKDRAQSIFNPGALARLTINDLSRSVQVIIYDFASNAIQFHSLNAAPSDEICNIEYISQQPPFEQLERLMAALPFLDNIEISQNFLNYIHQIGLQLGFTDAIISLAQQYYSQIDRQSSHVNIS